MAIKHSNYCIIVIYHVRVLIYDYKVPYLNFVTVFQLSSILIMTTLKLNYNVVPFMTRGDSQDQFQHLEGFENPKFIEAERV